MDPRTETEDLLEHLDQQGSNSTKLIQIIMLCVRACVRVRERERERKKKSKTGQKVKNIINKFC